MRKRLLTDILVAGLLLTFLTACGSFDKSSSAIQGAGVADLAPSYGATANGVGASKGDVAFNESYDYDSDFSYSESESGDVDPGDNVQGGTEIDKDMLVYRGSVSITTKEYDSALEALSELYSKYDCFIESSNEYSNYRYSDGSTMMTYRATIRVNSKDYDTFMNGVSNLGVVASKSSNVQNMNMEYSDTVTALRIYQARLDRYLARLETETDNEIAIQLEREVTDIQVTLQQLEARKSLIETDVAYSYVDLEIEEVKAYTSQITHDDPLHKRVWAEIVNTYYEFTEFLTNLLFFIIHAFPYLVILGIVVFVLRKKFKGCVKLPRLKKRKKSNEGDKDKTDS